MRRLGKAVLPAAGRRRGAVGTGRFASLSNHEGEPLGRRDDAETVGLMCVYLRAGALPWSDGAVVDAPTKRERFARMLECKQRTSAAALGHAFGEGGAAIEEYVNVVRALGHTERPPYGHLMRLLRAAAA